MQIIICIIATFIATVLWQKWADRKNKPLLRVFIQGMMNELDTIAKKIGHNDVWDYWEATKGNDYCQNVKKNLEGAIKALQ